MDISARQIASKKVRGNNVDFSTSEITSKKVRGNKVDFSTIENTSKKYVENDMEIRQNLAFDVSTWYQRQINMD